MCYIYRREDNRGDIEIIRDINPLTWRQGITGELSDGDIFKGARGTWNKSRGRL